MCDDTAVEWRCSTPTCNNKIGEVYKDTVKIQYKGRKTITPHAVMVTCEKCKYTNVLTEETAHAMVEQLAQQTRTRLDHERHYERRRSDP